MLKQKIYIGLTDKDGIVNHPENGLQAISEILDKFKIEGSTVFNAIGTWKGAQEKTLILEVWDVESKTLFELAHELKSVFNQETVAVTVKTVDGYFI